MSRKRSFVGSARLIAVLTLLSRITGLVRDVALNTALGQTWVMDAFNYGFQIPNLFRRLFGEGALSAVFIPTFTETLHHRGHDAAWTLLGKVLARISVILISLTVAIELSTWMIWLFVPTAPSRTLIIVLTSVMLPFMLTICLVALFGSILNCLEQFAVPAALPIVLNIMTVIGIKWIGPLFGEKPEQQVFGAAIGVLAAGVLQLGFIWWYTRRQGARTPWQWVPRDPELRPMFVAFIPIVLGQGVLLLNSFMDTQICTLLSRPPSAPDRIGWLGGIGYPLESGALSAVMNAQRLYQFPLGVLAISLATAAFPTFSRFAAEKNMDGLRRSLHRALRLAIFEGLPCGLVLTVLAEPMIRLLFQRGEFTPDATHRAAIVLRWYGLGVWAFCLQHVVLRGFYSIKDTRTPMVLGIWLMGLNLAISTTLIWFDSIREQAFAISTVITAVLNVGFSLWLLGRRIGRPDRTESLTLPAVRMLIGALAAAATALVLQRWLAPQLNLATLSGRCGEVFLPLGAAIVVYLLCGWITRLDDLRHILGRSRI